MNVQNLIQESIQKAAADVFSTMLGVELPPGEFAIEQVSPPVNDGVVSLIGLAGPWVGLGSISCNPAVACRICSLMLMMETTAVTEDVLDAVAELTNMVIGSVKNDLETHLGPLALSIPTVVFGRNFKTRSAGSSEWMVVRFPWDGEVLSVKLFLAPAEKAPHSVAHAAGQHCTFDV
jgi:chemotaxis protein CheX